MSADASLTSPATAPLLPRPLAIYYGWPSQVNGADGDVDHAARQLARYDTVVFGDTLPFPGSDPSADEVIARLPGGCRWYGYVSLSVPATHRRWRRGASTVSTSHGTRHFEVRAMADVRARLGRWAAWGARGILLDCAGSDYGVPPMALATAVGASHDLGLAVVVNAWAPDDVGTCGAPFEPGDALLAENDVVRHGRVRAPGEYRTRLAAIEEVRQRLGLAVWAVATTSHVGTGSHAAGRDDATRPPGPPRWDPALVVQIAAAWRACGIQPPARLAIADPLYGAAGDRLALPAVDAHPPEPAMTTPGDRETAVPLDTAR